MAGPYMPRPPQRPTDNGVMRPDPPGPIRTLHDTELRELAGELVALQRRAYRVEAELIGDDRIPQLSETAAELTGADLVWKTVHDDAQVVAALAYSIEEGVLEIDRLVADPAWHRRGLARALLASLPALPHGLDRAGQCASTGALRFPAVHPHRRPRGRSRALGQRLRARTLRHSAALLTVHLAALLISRSAALLTARPHHSQPGRAAHSTYGSPSPSRTIGRPASNHWSMPPRTSTAS